jgi:hypothetical protein
MLFVRAGGRPGSGLAGQAGAQPHAKRWIQAKADGGRLRYTSVPSDPNRSGPSVRLP